MKTIAYVDDGYLNHHHVEDIIAKLRKESGDARIVVISAGNFLSDGHPTQTRASIRAEMQIQSGADLVLSLPLATSLGGYGKKPFASAALLDRLHIIDEVVITCRPIEDETAEECGRKLREAAMWIFQEKPPYREALTAYMDRGLTFSKAQLAAIIYCMPEMKRYLRNRENRKAVRMMDAMLQLYYTPKLDFVDISDVMTEVHSELLTTIRDAWLRDQFQIRPVREVLDHQAAVALRETIFTGAHEAEYLNSIFGSSEKTTNFILEHRGIFFEETLYSRILARLSSTLDAKREKEEAKAPASQLKISEAISEEWIEEAAAQNEASREFLRLMLLRTVLGITHNDMLINGLHTYIPYCRVLAEKPLSDEEWRVIREKSWVPVVHEARGIDDTKGEFELLRAIDSKAKLLFTTAE